MDDRAWTYEAPTRGFREIKDHVSFYTGPWECFVDGEKVEPPHGFSFAVRVPHAKDVAHAATQAALPAPGSAPEQGAEA